MVVHHGGGRVLTGRPLSLHRPTDPLDRQNRPRPSNQRLPGSQGRLSPGEPARRLSKPSDRSRVRSLKQIHNSFAVILFATHADARLRFVFCRPEAGGGWFSARWSGFPPNAPRPRPHSNRQQTLAAWLWVSWSATLHHHPKPAHALTPDKAVLVGLLPIWFQLWFADFVTLL